MQLIVDLHIHSHFSRATSKDMNISSLYRWGKLKGINIIGTGDFTHPEWFAELQEKLEPAEPGLFKLKETYAVEEDKLLPASCKDKLIRFFLTVEISNIYSRHEKVRKLHNIIVVPSFKAASWINGQLQRIGNLKADGRPILGMDSERLLEITVESDPQSMFIPAHIWTPWFAMFGSKSGFNTLEEAFGKHADKIHAVETGLSSDPFMNWRLSQLDGLTLVSNSDAHSARNLGREANMVDCELTYEDIYGAITTNDKRFVGTIEFFPQEGKYHYDGHRACNVRFTPEETKAHNGICPKCGQPVVVGVDYRVEELADRPHDYKPKNHKLVQYIIPLAEMLREIVGIKSVSSPKVAEQYDKILATFGSEFEILRNVETAEVRRAGFPELSTALEKMRAGAVYIEPGYDGVYGVVQVFKPGELAGAGGQLGLGL